MPRLFGRRSSKEPVGVVRLLIYSGRPNLEWHLGSTELDQLKSRLDKTVHGETTEPSSPSRGGYQGFLVFLEGDDM
jgi:hypothetical protein